MVCSGASHDKVKMYLPSLCTGRMPKSGLLLQGALAACTQKVKKRELVGRSFFS